jgi:hypothetical protein
VNALPNLEARTRRYIRYLVLIDQRARLVLRRILERDPPGLGADDLRAEPDPQESGCQQMLETTVLVLAVVSALQRRVLPLSETAAEIEYRLLLTRLALFSSRPPREVSAELHDWLTRTAEPIDLWSLGNGTEATPLFARELSLLTCVQSFPVMALKPEVAYYLASYCAISDVVGPEISLSYLRVAIRDPAMKWRADRNKYFRSALAANSSPTN